MLNCPKCGEEIICLENPETMEDEEFYCDGCFKKFIGLDKRFEKEKKE